MDGYSKSLLLENEYSSSINNGVIIKEPRSLLLDSMEEDNGDA